jgi:aminobenzoyl-glutamate transport protein
MGTPQGSPRRSDRWLKAVERWGNRLPDPALLFVLLLLVVWALSALLAPVAFQEIDPRSGQPLRVDSQLTGAALTRFLVDLVPTFTGFKPLGVVLVAMLGVGVAERTGLIAAGLKLFVAATPPRLLTPAVLVMAIVSHSAADAGFVLVIPVAGLLYHAAGRHPLAGVAAGFAGVSGGFSANFIPSTLDPLLAGLTQAGAQLVDPQRVVNPLCNWFFTSASCLLIVGLGWLITDRVVEPRLAGVAVDGEPPPGEQAPRLQANERRGLLAALASLLLLGGLLLLAAAPAGSPLRAPNGTLTAADAPLMQAIVAFIFLFFIVPGIVYGIAARSVASHRDIVQGMADAMSTMATYIVMAFCASLFIAAFGKSNLGALLALKGASGLQALGMPSAVTLMGIIGLSGFVNLFIGSASAKWALLAPILVPMLMTLDISPELTQAAYRIGDSTTNIITPLMPYFPLVVVYCRRWVKSAGIGTLVSLMLPYSVVFLVAWTGLLLAWWGAGLPLGL